MKDIFNQAAAAIDFRGFVRLCICFGLAQGAVITAVTYSTTFMNETVGSYCDGFFFGAFTLSSFLFADGAVALLGRTRAYRMSLLAFLLYDLSLWLSYHIHYNSHRHGAAGSGAQRALAQGVAYSGCVVGGLGFSLHWTSQSVIYQHTARRYASRRGLSVEVVNDTFSGLFAAVYVPFEMGCKQAASLLLYFAARQATSDDDDDGEEEDAGGVSSLYGNSQSGALNTMASGAAATVPTHQRISTRLAHPHTPNDLSLLSFPPRDHLALTSDFLPVDELGQLPRSVAAATEVVGDDGQDGEVGNDDDDDGGLLVGDTTTTADAAAAADEVPHEAWVHFFVLLTALLLLSLWYSKSLFGKRARALSAAADAFAKQEEEAAATATAAARAGVGAKARGQEDEAEDEAEDEDDDLLGGYGFGGRLGGMMGGAPEEAATALLGRSRRGYGSSSQAKGEFDEAEEEDGQEEEGEQEEEEEDDDAPFQKKPGACAATSHGSSGGSGGCRGCLERMVGRLAGTPRMLVENKVLQCLMPTSVAFGVAAGFMFAFYYDETVARYRGDAAVGLMAAVGSGVCSLSAVPISLLSSSPRVGKGPVIALGGLSLGLIGAGYLVMGNAWVASSWGGVVGVNALLGLGRAVWENTNKAAFADLFSPREAPAAFANMYMVTGLLTFLSLFVFPSLPLWAMATCILVPAALMYPGYHRAVHHRHRLSSSSRRHAARQSAFTSARAAARAHTQAGAAAAAASSSSSSSSCSVAGGHQTRREAPSSGRLGSASSSLVDGGLDGDADESEGYGSVIVL